MVDEARRRAEAERRREQAAAERERAEAQRASAKQASEGEMEARRQAELKARAQYEAARRQQAEAASQQRQAAEGARARAAAEAARARAPDEVELRRYPNFERPDSVAPRARFAVSISLTEQQIMAAERVTAAPGTEVDESGALKLRVAAGEVAQFDVMLTAPGFRLVDGNVRTIALPTTGDSDPALFMLEAPAEAGPRTLTATLWRDGAYVARLMATVQVEATSTAARPQRAAPPRAEPVAAPVALGAADARVAPDLTVFVTRDPATADRFYVIVDSPHLERPQQETWVRPPEFGGWLTSRYRALVAASARSRGAAAGGAGTVAAAPADVQALLAGFSRELHDRYAPPAFRNAYAALARRLGPRFRTIQIHTSDPVFPWELLAAPVTAGQESRVIGARQAIARWHFNNGDARNDRPPLPRIAASGVSVIAPGYAGADALPASAGEVEQLSRLPGFERLPGRLAAVAAGIPARSGRIVHVIAHGHAEVVGGAPVFAVKLEDGDIDETTWRGIIERAATAGARPFVFLNACDVGRNAVYAGFVQGWAPSTLEAGGAGLIGALWPIDDAVAARYAGAFYERIRAEGEAPAIGQTLADLRARFYETGDVTYLAYVLYGDVSLRINWDAAATRAPGS
jgi:hypothetical protein